nr:hypothetical protein [Actinomycetota bacterium]
PVTGSYEVARGVVPRERIDDALRLLHLDLLSRGAPAEELSEWLWSLHWFPHLRQRPEILALAESLPEEWKAGRICDPQILLQFPHAGPEPEISFHLDREPDWADGSRYLRIVGVPLSSWRGDNGGLLVETPEGPAPIEADPGDAVAMTPDLPHSSGINRSGSVRYGVYFRWLEEPA